jgi:hypothetical protein
MLSTVHEFSADKLAVFEHMKQLHQRPMPDLFTWGQRFIALWVCDFLLSQQICQLTLVF